MLMSCRFYIVGLHFLLLSHIAHTFVLSVDVEDLKKLAQKFVSDSVADRLTNFVFRATKNMMDNNAKDLEENDAFDSQDKISEENIKHHPRTAKSKKTSQESSREIESTKEKPASFAKDEPSISKTSEEDKKHNKNRVKSKYLEDDSSSSLSEETKTKRHEKNAEPVPYKHESGFSNKTIENNSRKHDTADTEVPREEFKLAKEESAGIDIPNNEFKQFTEIQRSKDNEIEPKEETTSKLDAFDINIYKKTNDEDVFTMSSRIDKGGEERWWEKELPRSQYFDNAPLGRNVGPE